MDAINPPHFNVICFIVVAILNRSASASPSPTQHENSIQPVNPEETTIDKDNIHQQQQQHHSNNNDLHSDNSAFDSNNIHTNQASNKDHHDKNSDSNHHGNDSDKHHHGNDSDKHHHGNDSDKHHHGIHVASIRFDYVRKPFIFSIFIVVTVIAKIGFHHADFLSSWMPETCLLILLGLIVGGILHLFDIDFSGFYYIEPKFFFLFLLPPCILEASYGLHDKVFFANLGTIIVYAILGTMLNCFLIGSLLYGLAWAGAMGAIRIKFIECFVFSSLIVAVDPVAVLAIFQEIGVNSVLYFLVFGESLLNDAVTVVLYNTITTLGKMDSIPASEICLALAAFFTVSLGGLLVGIIFGVLTAILTRFTNHVRVVEPLAILGLSYVAYLTAELFHFSGIISMIGCGLIQMQYAFHNISENSSITIKYFIKMLSRTCDCIIFIFLGIAVVRDELIWNPGFILWTVVLCLLVRFLVTYGLTYIINKTQRERQRKIGAREQFIMAYGGLRGAVAFCLVAMLEPSEHKALFRTATLVVIFFTVFIQGITIKPLVKCLKIEGEEEKIVSLCQEINRHVMDHVLTYMEEVIGNYGHNSIQDRLNTLNDKYLKKVLQRDPLSHDEVLMELYQKILLQQHYESVYGMNTSSQMHLYKPELIRRQSRTASSLENRMSLTALSRNLSQAEGAMVDDDVMRPKDLSIYNAAMALSPKLMQSRSKSYSESAPKSPDVTKSPSKWKITTNRLISSDPMQQSDNELNTLLLRTLLNKSSHRDAFSRHSDKNLIEGDKSDLLLLLNEKQQRHLRFIENQGLAGSRDRSRNESLENPAKKRKTIADMVRMNRYKTLDLDNRTNPEGSPVAPLRSKRPLSAQCLTTAHRTFTEMAPLMPLKEEAELHPSTQEEAQTQQPPRQQPQRHQPHHSTPQHSTPHHSPHHSPQSLPENNPIPCTTVISPEEPAKFGHILNTQTSKLSPSKGLEGQAHPRRDSFKRQNANDDSPTKNI